jgi:hypothetical protein
MTSNLASCSFAFDLASSSLDGIALVSQLVLRLVFRLSNFAAAGEPARVELPARAAPQGRTRDP